MTSYICFSCFIFIGLLHCANNTLLSRYRNPNEYLSPSDSQFIQQLPQDMFDSLIDERPDLKHILEPLRRSTLRHPVLETKAGRNHADFRELYPDDTESDEEYDDDEETSLSDVTTRRYQLEELEEEDNNTMGEEYNTMGEEYNTTTVEEVSASPKVKNATRLLPFLSRPAIMAQNWWFFGPDSRYQGPWKASCFLCNKNRDIPIDPICHSAFESDDWRYRTMARFLRVNCYYNEKFNNRIKEYNWKGTYKYTSDRGLKREYYGRFRSGCFKRFLDLGRIYTARGCRGVWPTGENYFPSHRFRRLEVLLHREKEACISSPHASLTPFARGISLFTRYHVCVCNTKYCNSAVGKNISTQFIIVSLLFLFFL